MNAKINQKNSLSEDFILLKIKKHKKNLIVISGVLFLFIILFIIIFNNYYYNFLFGPFYKNSSPAYFFLKYSLKNLTKLYQLHH
mgnify:CR=1 FL=1